MNSSPQGGYFTASPADPILSTWAAAANAYAPYVLPASAPTRLVARPAEDSGLGVFVRDGCTIQHGDPLAAYWGHLTRRLNRTSKFVLEVPAVKHEGGHVPVFIDAHQQCSYDIPLPTHAGLLNHACEDPSCTPHLARPPGCPLPIVILKSRRSLRGGTDLTYNYDSHRRSDAYTISAADAALLASRGCPSSPCRCARPLPCPHQRFFP